MLVVDKISISIGIDNTEWLHIDFSQDRKYFKKTGDISICKNSMGLYTNCGKVFYNPQQFKVTILQRTSEVFELHFSYTDRPPDDFLILEIRSKSDVELIRDFLIRNGYFQTD